MAEAADGINIKALICPRCHDTIFSRATHDFRTCSCGGVFIDGGFDYCRFGITDPAIDPKTIAWTDIFVKISKKELHDDWKTGKDMFGLMMSEESKLRKKRARAKAKNRVKKEGLSMDDMFDPNT